METDISPADFLVSLATRASGAASEFVHHLASPAASDPKTATPSVPAALATLAAQAWKTAQAAYVTARPGATDGEPHRRRWRAKT
jgi:hypothetical protein